MAKTTQNIFQILINGTIAYLKNIFPLSEAMLFPVVGQVVGVIAILFPAYWLEKHFEKLAHFQIDTHSLASFCLVLIISVLPGFFIFTKAFWEYMVAMASLNLTAGSILKGNSARSEHFKAYSYAIKSRGKGYVWLILILSFIWLLALIVPAIVNVLLATNPLLPLISGVSFVLSLGILTAASIYLSLSFQVFALEEISVWKVLQRSWGLVQGNFIRTCFLGIVLAIITSIAVPYVVQSLVQNTMAITYAAMPLKAYYASLFGNFQSLTAIPGFSMFHSLAICTNKQTSTICLTDLSQSTVLGTLDMIIAGLMLPLGSICYTLLYFDIIDRKSAKK